MKVLALELLSVVILIEILEQLRHGTPNLRVDVCNGLVVGWHGSPDGRETPTRGWHSRDEVL